MCWRSAHNVLIVWRLTILSRRACASHGYMPAHQTLTHRLGRAVVLWVHAGVPCNWRGPLLAETPASRPLVPQGVSDGLRRAPARARMEDIQRSRLAKAQEPVSDTDRLPDHRELAAAVLAAAVTTGHPLAARPGDPMVD